MKALVTHAPNDYRYEEVAVPKVGDGEILLRIKGCGICAGDIKSFHGGIRIWGTTPENRYIEAPVIGGHEFFGEVVELGKGVTDFKVGDNLVTEQIVPCNSCKFCKEGTYWMCTESAVYGFKQHAQGGFAEYALLHRNSINHKVPESFNDEQAVLIEPLACGMHAVEIADIQPDDFVVVAGLGAIGSAIVNMVKTYKPKAVIGIDIKENRLGLGRKFGADYVFNPMDTDVVEEINKLTDGLGCHVYIEASGSPKSVEQGLQALRNLGTYVQMGVFAEEVTVDWNIIGDGKELTIRGSHLSALTYDKVINGILSGQIKTEGLISHRFPLADWKAAFSEAENNGDAMKIMLIP